MSEPAIINRRAVVVVDPALYVWADGVKVARFSVRGGDVFLQFFDRNKYRAFDRGTSVVEVAVWDLLQALSALFISVNDT